MEVVGDQKESAQLTTKDVSEELVKLAVDEQGEKQLGAASEPEQQDQDLQPGASALTAEPSETDSFVQEPNVLVYHLSAEDDSIQQALSALVKQVRLFGWAELKFKKHCHIISRLAVVRRNSQNLNRCSLLSQRPSPGQGLSLRLTQPSQIVSLCSSQPHPVAQIPQTLPSMHLTTLNRWTELQQQYRVQPLQVLQQCK